MNKKVFKVYLILACLDHICITTQQPQKEDSGCAVYFNLFRWATGRCLLFLRLFLLLLYMVFYVKYFLKSLLFWCHLFLAQSRDKWSFQNRKKYILKSLNGLENPPQRACNLFPGILLALLGKAFLLLTCLFPQS